MSTENWTPPKPAGGLSIYAVGMSLGLFLAITFALCVGFGLTFPQATMYQAWLPLLPGVRWISWPSFLLGLAEAFAYGWYVALIFVPLHRYFAGGSGALRTHHERKE